MNEEAKNRFYGKYRGTVLNNVDPMLKGRIQVQVPDVLQLSLSTWATPCVPMTGLQAGMFTVPPIGAAVWVEFERGDPNLPIWVGGFYGTPAEVPALAQATPPGVQSIIFNTQLQNTLLISDVPGPTGGFLLKTTTGAMISINDTGILISNGKGATIAMTGPTVTINAGALVVT
jgi:uncharacterized protein involved in type VI secretion and phage assembly